MTSHFLDQRSSPHTRGSRALWIAIAAVAVLCAPRTAAAQSSSVSATLRYLRDPSASRCPDESALRTAVASRLGYDPFVATSPLTIMVSITRVSHTLRARVWRESAEAPPSTPRTLSSPHLDCTELASVVALTVAIAVDPLTATGTPSSSSPAPASSSAPPASEESAASASPAPVTATSSAPPAEPLAVSSPPPASTTPARVDDAIRPVVRLGVYGTIGFEPFVTVGFLGAGGVRWRAYSLELEVAGSIPSAITDANGVRARAGLITGALVPCVHVGWFAACGIVRVGALRGEIEGAQPAAIATPFAAIGARAALDVRIAGPFALYAHADLLAALTPTELRLDGATVWSSFPVSGTLGVGVAAHFR